MIPLPSDIAPVGDGECPIGAVHLCPASCRFPTFDKGTQSHLLILPTPHRLAVDTQCERGIGVAHLVHDDARVLADRVEDAREGASERVRCDAFGKR